jgi:phage terminase large subunit
MTVKEVNPHFEDFLFDWNHKFYFLVGGYGSSKSYHVALKLMLKLLQEKRTALVVREVYETIRESCFSLLSEIAVELGLEGRVKFITSPMSVRFPNGSKIIFRGVDKPEKLKSIHNVSLVWLEECSEIKYDGFKELLGRLRHPSMKLHMLLSTNPVSTSNWCYKYFFQDKQNKRITLDDEELYKERTIILNDTYYHHSTADDNLFLPADYVEQLEDLKTHDLDLYRIARRGRFGVNGKRVLPQFEVQPDEVVDAAVKRIPSSMKKNGMDFGFVTSYNAVVRLAIDHKQKYLYIYWEYYKNGQTDDRTAEDLQELKRERIKADAAEPKTIKYFKQQGFRMEPAKKFPGSRLQYTKKVKRFKKIICAERCVNVIDELKDLTYKENKQGELIEDEFNIDPHTFSAIWYALDDYEVSDLKGVGVSNKNAFSR